MSQISDSEIEDIMIEIQKMNLNETKEVNPIGHVGGPRKIKEEHPKTFETHYRIPKYEPRESNIEQLGNTGVYLDIDCQKNIKTVLNKWSQAMTLYFMTQGTSWDNNTKTQIMVGTLTGCVRKWWEGLSAPSFNVITNCTTVAFESSIFEGVDTFVRYIVNEFLGEEWMIDSVEQRRKDIREARNKLSQLQICRMKYIYEYTCEFRKWYYDAFDSNMNMTILANTYYEKLPGKWSTYFQEEYEKIKIENADTLGARIEFLKKRLTDLCTQRYVVNGAKYGEKIFCDKIDNIPGKLGCKEFRKRKFRKQLGQPRKNFTKYKKFRKEWKKPFKKYYKKKFNYKR